jgi:hypothetical protein
VGVRDNPPNRRRVADVFKRLDDAQKIAAAPLLCGRRPYAEFIADADSE